jgi:hypothetical protein
MLTLHLASTIFAIILGCLPNDPSLLSMLFLKYSGMDHGLLNSVGEEFVCYGYSPGWNH